MMFKSNKEEDRIPAAAAADGSKPKKRGRKKKAKVSKFKVRTLVGCGGCACPCMYAQEGKHYVLFGVPALLTDTVIVYIPLSARIPSRAFQNVH